MAIYSDMAKFYDVLTDDVMYEKWAGYIERLFLRYKQKPEIVLDLACGTGSLSRLLSQRGYDVIGVDASPEMLSAASEKTAGLEKPPLFVCQKMEALDLYGTVDCALCCLDSVNYLRNISSLNAAFKRVGLFLRPGGLFIFDVNTERKFKNMHLQAYVREKEGVFCAWQAQYSEKTKKANFCLNFFEETKESIYNRFTEYHTERAYSLSELGTALKAGGMEILDVLGELTLRRANESDERIFVTAKYCDSDERGFKWIKSLTL
jgi:SAM-dependent methyltransferase